MSLEIERKFLVDNDSYKAMAVAIHHIEQYYLSTDVERTVRVRILDERGFITVKGRNRGLTRSEWEYEIPVADARAMIALCDGRGVSKNRYMVPYNGHLWEVDVFEGRHQGLVVAEVELAATDEAVDLPPFAGREVSGDNRYYNSALSLQ